MLFPVGRLIEGRNKPLCVPRDTKVSDALALMVEHDYSQLPIVDEDGDLCGIISENSIISTYYHAGGAVSLLDLTVDHCQTSPVTISPGRDVFEALDLLRNVYAIVVVENRKPVGILTDYDTTQFFNDLSEGLIFVQDIEVKLREYIERIFCNERAIQAALLKAFKHGKRDPARPAREYEELSFREHIQLITAEGNWSKFRCVFEPKDLFVQLMEQVGQIRNQLAHFRGRLDPVQRHALLRAREWLDARPKLALPAGIAQEAVRVEVTDFLAYRPVSEHKPLENWLWQQKAQASNIRISFEDIEKLLGDALPPTAREHRSWWANDPTSSTQSLAWLAAGWRVDDVDLVAGRVVFRQTDSVLMQLFFADLLTRLKEARPGVTRATKTFPQSWWSFGAGKTGFNFAWVFTRGSVLQVELYIDTGDKADNKAAFDKLYDQRETIEGQIGAPLDWERLDRKQASRVALKRLGTTINDPPDELEKAKQWVIEATLRFIDVFRPRITEL